MTFKLTRKVKQFFGENRKLFCASAPGRLDVMGGIADYSGSLVLQMPIKERTIAVAGLRDDSIIRIYSATAAVDGGQDFFEIENDALFSGSKKTLYQRIRRILGEHSNQTWAAYVLGCFAVLSVEKDVEIKGADVWIDSNVPIGKGVASSAALEVAVMTALAAAYRLAMDRTELPVLAQKVENHVVNAPCGLMDQLVSYLGKSGRLLPILCQPDRVFESLNIPSSIRFVGIDSGVRHSVGGASYSDVRAAAFMGYSMLAHQFGYKRKKKRGMLGKEDLSKIPFRGYLANISPSFFVENCESLLPETMEGKAYINLYGESFDLITQPVEDQFYNVRDCTAHPIFEHHRIELFKTIFQFLDQKGLERKKRVEILTQLGELMFQSHASYNRCGLGEDRVNSIVNALRKAGAEQGVYGAKITGGGSGGTVCVLCEGKKGLDTVHSIADQIATDFDYNPFVFTGSSEGAFFNGVNQIKV